MIRALVAILAATSTACAACTQSKIIPRGCSVVVPDAGMALDYRIFGSTARFAITSSTAGFSAAAFVGDGGVEDAVVGWAGRQNVVMPVTYDGGRFGPSDTLIWNATARTAGRGSVVVFSRDLATGRVPVSRTSNKVRLFKGDAKALGPATASLAGVVDMAEGTFSVEAGAVDAAANATDAGTGAQSLRPTTGGVYRGAPSVLAAAFVAVLAAA